MRIRFAPSRVAVLIALLANQVSPAADGGAKRGLPAEDSFFPLAVWLQSPRNAERYKGLGINVYVALWRGPTDDQLDQLDKAGMYAICVQNSRGLEHRDRKTIAGWMHNDEPDNAQSLGRGKGYGPPVAPEKIVDDYRRMKATDPDRPVLLNLGQGVAWDGWYGRGVRSRHPEDYPKYVQGCDIVSFDIYPAVHDREEVSGKLWYVGYGVQRLVEWTEGKKPVWACIETTHVDAPDKLPTPAQIRSEVWMAIIHGASGIIYFCHDFKPQPIEAGLLAHEENARAVKEVNAQVRELAPVIHSPTVKDAVTVTSSDGEVPIATLCKRRGGSTYVFAVSMREGPTTGTFTLAGAKGETGVEVIGENRRLSGADGKFDDRFDGYGVHLYRIGP
jgi:hypothetical protein